MNYLLKMLSQPSSYAGLAALALAFGVSQPLYEHIATAAAGVFGLVAFLADSKRGQS